MSSTRKQNVSQVKSIITIRGGKVVKKLISSPHKLSKESCKMVAYYTFIN